ncbi:Aste57867_18213 [Aphanomyces stellatus]|uniref:Aste57867_18213 protein n=1 Tax=Aphanomyces stellatus TaxID=120398 RepID=A0A485LAD7_9STRA|nr:hypothetical protein As57867_018151 [Aphanomyces stellatus]VFT94951.1 Aste57867_18213 [Aphanomyces stellatus]
MAAPEADMMLALLNLYRAMNPTEQFMQTLRGCDGYTTLEFQDLFMTQVVQNTICDDYAPKRSYTFRILKLYVQDVENAGEELSDLLLADVLASVCHKNVSLGSADLDELHHVSYRIPRAGPVVVDDVITCRVAAAHNEVGMKLWEAGFFLAEYALSHPHVFQGKRILELGAGAGFTGLVIAAMPSVAAHVMLTDYAPVVMQNLRYNIEVNAPRLTCPVTAMALDWTEWTWDADNATAYDLLIAGDCVYDVDAFPDMMHVLGSFLDGDKAAAAIFASTLRNQKTFDAFLTQLRDHAIVYEDITAAAAKDMPQYYDYANRDSIRLCRLTRSLPLN